MVRPAGFHSNPVAARSNNFMQSPDLTRDEEQAAAEREFDGLVAALEDSGIRVIVVNDTLDPETPDAIFPNNWISTHADGTVVTYPMQVENRRPERRQDIVDTLAAEHGFRVTDVIDLSGHEAKEQYLEGTGSLVLDRRNAIAYACLSPRTSLEVLADFAQRLDYEVVAFEAADGDGVAIYHTNVMMNVGEDFAVVCLESIAQPEQRSAVRHSLESTGHEIIEITLAQMQSMAGNMLEVRSADGGRRLAMSAQARDSLTDEQLKKLEARTTIVSAPIERIESSAGGSVRCVLAEVHLPVQDAQQNL